MISNQPALQTCSAALAAHCDLVYLDLGGTVVELIAYEGASVEPAPKKEHLGYRVKFESCLLHRGVSDKLLSKETKSLPKMGEARDTYLLNDYNSIFSEILSAALSSVSR